MNFRQADDLRFKSLPFIARIPCTPCFGRLSNKKCFNIFAAVNADVQTVWLNEFSSILILIQSNAQIYLNPMKILSENHHSIDLNYLLSLLLVFHSKVDFIFIFVL